MTVYVYTSIALNYFPKARVLSTTLKKFHPNWKFCLVISEDVTPEMSAEILSYNDIDEVIPYNTLEITDGFGKVLSDEEASRWRFKHALVEFCTAVKGSALCELLNRSDCEAVFYFDPDIAIFDNLEQLTEHFKTNSILLTPHLIDIEKYEQAVWDNEISILKHGIYNLGFVGVKNDASGHKFAKWWKDRLDLHCYDDIPNGVFTDQSWCDMVPAVFSGVKVLRDPQYNVATWNLTHRRVDGNDLDSLYVNENYKLCFYHFSGFDSGSQYGELKKYGADMPKLFALRDWYINECARLENTKFSARKWQFDFYNDGTKITKEHRRLYRRRPDLIKRFSDPFNAEYLAWYSANMKNNIDFASEDIRLQAILNSYSWKITRPLRIISSLFRKIVSK